MTRRIVQLWTSPEARNALKSKAAALGMPLSKYLEKMACEDQPLLKQKQKKRIDWFGL